MSWVWEHAPVSGNELLILLAIADHASDDGSDAWPSIETLAKKCRLSERTIQRAIKSLAERGQIRVGRQQGGPSYLGPRQRPNVYTIVMRGDRLSPHADSGVTNDAVRGDKDGDSGVTQLCHPNHPENHPKPSADLSVVRSSLERAREGLRGREAS